MAGPPRPTLRRGARSPADGGRAAGAGGTMRGERSARVRAPRKVTPRLKPATGSDRQELPPDAQLQAQLQDFAETYRVQAGQAGDDLRDDAHPKQVTAQALA